MVAWNRSSDLTSAVRTECTRAVGEISEVLDFAEPSETASSVLRVWFGHYQELWRCLDCARFPRTKFDRVSEFTLSTPTTNGVDSETRIHLQQSCSTACGQTGAKRGGTPPSSIFKSNEFGFEETQQGWIRRSEFTCNKVARQQVVRHSGTCTGSSIDCLTDDPQLTARCRVEETLPAALSGDWDDVSPTWFRTKRDAMKHRLVCQNAQDPLAPQVTCFSALLSGLARHILSELEEPTDQSVDPCAEWERTRRNVLTHYPTYLASVASPEPHPKMPKIGTASDPRLSSILRSLSGFVNFEDDSVDWSEQLRTASTANGAFSLLLRWCGPDFCQLWFCSGCVLRNEVLLLNLIYRQLKLSPLAYVSFTCSRAAEYHLESSTRCAKRERPLYTLSDVVAARAQEILSREPELDVSDEGLDDWYGLRSTVVRLYPYLLSRSRDN
jgi:hypothetical protein